MSGQDGSMQLTKLGHACLHITHGDASVLIDPGTFSSGFEKAGEAIDYLRAVSPQVAVPIHQRTLAMPEMEYQRFEGLRPADTAVCVLSDGASMGPP